jgi:DNA-binding HxlR family transcriptional regulator
MNSKAEKPCDWRSKCPLNIALELVGDRWTLLILRDLLIKQFSSFKQFQESGEGIATNVLTDRLKKLVECGIIASERSAEDARVVTYRPTERGLDLLPVIIEMIIWADRYEETAAPPKIMRRLLNDREGFIRDVRSRLERQA